MKHGLALVLLLASLCPVFAGAAETLAHGRFPRIVLHAPAAPVARFVILLSDGDGWTETTDRLAAALADDGALVAGIDVAALGKSLAGDDCVNVVGDLENLAHFVQGYRRLPAYFTPVLAGVGSGAAFARATLVQAPDGIFAGLVSLDFCARIALPAPLCAIEERPIARSARAQRELAPLRSAVPWRALTRSSSRCPGTDLDAYLRGMRDVQRREVDEAGAPAALRAAVRALAPPPASPPSAILQDLPLVEVPAATRGPRCAVLLSGDGGWAGLDKDLAAALAAQGLPVVGFDSLRYFWSARTPAGLAADLDRVIRAYAARWHCTEVVLVGYSQGADVLPFAVNRLPRTARRLVAGLVLLGPGARASFEFHLESWLHRDDEGLPIAPELARLSGREVLCVYGRDDEDAICPQLSPAQARPLALPGDHHFDGDYAALAARVLAALAVTHAPAAPGRPSHAGTTAR